MIDFAPYQQELQAGTMLAIQVEAGSFEDALESGHVQISIDDDTYPMILENIEGNLLVNVNPLPDTFHGCYMYNNGVFPYVFNKALSKLLLIDSGGNGSRFMVCDISSCCAVAGTRFRFQGPGEPSVEDPDGDSCLWSVDFGLENIEVREPQYTPKVYLFRWNPGISSFTIDRYIDATTQCPDGFYLNWSIYEYEQAHRGDIYYMLRTGDDKAGIYFMGEFYSEPYADDDWAGKSRKRHYVDISCHHCCPADGEPRIGLAELQRAIPSVDWTRGHSGQLLTDEQARALEDLWNSKTE